MKLYCHPFSTSARRVTVTAAALGQQLETRIIDLMSPADRAELVALNPNSKIPVLVDGDFVLWESHAIMQYLCDRTPGQTLYPTDPRARADVNRWLFWISAHLSPAIGGVGWERMWKKKVTGQDADPTLLAFHLGMFEKFGAILNAHLAKHTWLATPVQSLADLSLAATLFNAELMDLPLGKLEHVRAHLGRVPELAAWKQREAAPQVAR